MGGLAHSTSGSPIADGTNGTYATYGTFRCKTTR
jgi:hypothetical protein